ncbi:MAG: prenyltransferase [Gammaproteobacteria bacterium]
MSRTTVTTLIQCARPPFLFLTPCCLSLPLAFAFSEGAHPGRLVLVLILVGALSAHISVNQLNEYYDFRSGLDMHTLRTPFSGGSGALPAMPACADAVRLCGLSCLLLTAAIGLYFVIMGAWKLLPLGLAGVLLVFFYTPAITHRPIVCLLAPGLGFGPAMILGSYYVLNGHRPFAVMIVSLMVLLVVSNLLLLNQFPDLDADREVGRLNVPILLGRRMAAKIYTAMLVLAYAILLLSVAFKLLPQGALWGMVTLVFAVPVVRRVLVFHDNMEGLLPAMGVNVALTLSLPISIALGTLFG